MAKKNPQQSTDAAEVVKLKLLLYHKKCQNVTDTGKKTKKYIYCHHVCEIMGQFQLT